MILYDLTAMQPHHNARVHGGGKFAEIVLLRMLERGVSFRAFFDSRRYLGEDLLKKLSSNNIQLYDIKDKSISDIISQIDNPLLFSIIPKQSYLECKTVGTIHDCREICTPSDVYRFKLKYRMVDIREYFLQVLFPKILKKHRSKDRWELLGNPNFVPTTISRFTKYTLYDVYKKDNILNMPIFMTPSYYEPTETNESYGDGKYVLMVSANRWVKNPIRAIKAMDEVFDNHSLKEYKFVVVGIDSSKEIRIKIKNKDNFIFKNYVSEKELVDLYKNCSFLLFPSLYEGFGMPPLEAMCYGKPVIASTYSAIPEVCGDGALYVNPFSVDDIRCKLLELMLDRNLYNEYKEKAILHFQNMYRLQKRDLDNYINFVIQLDNERNSNK